MSNKTRLQDNNTALQSLIDKANSLPEAGGSSNTSNTAGDWINIFSLPTTYLAAPGFTTYYLEIPENVAAIIVAYIPSNANSAMFIHSTAYKNGTNLSYYNNTTDFVILTDANGDGTILGIETIYTSDLYALPIYYKEV